LAITLRTFDAATADTPVTEREWRLLRSLHDTVLNRYCARVLEECGALGRDASASPHERYLRLFRMLQERDDTIAAAFNDARRSNAIHKLAAMVAQKMITDEELCGFTPETREAAVDLADIFWGTRRRRAR
jgi:hypothetical protein